MAYDTDRLLEYLTEYKKAVDHLKKKRFPDKAFPCWSHARAPARVCRVRLRV